MDKLNRTTWLTLIFFFIFYYVSYNFFDRPIAFYVDQHIAHFPWLFKSAGFFTGLAVGSYWMLILAFCYILLAALISSDHFRQNKNTSKIIFFAVSVTIAIVITSGIKFLLARYRPELLLKHGIYGFHFLSTKFLYTSTPSGHATRAFAVAVSLSILFKRLTPLFIALAVCIALSRIILEFHYLSDVVFGAVIGTLVPMWVATKFTVLRQN